MLHQRGLGLSIGCVGASSDTKGTVIVHLGNVSKDTRWPPCVDQELLPVWIHLTGIQMPDLQVDVPNVFPLLHHLEQHVHDQVTARTQSPHVDEAPMLGSKAAQVLYELQHVASAHLPVGALHHLPDRVTDGVLHIIIVQNMTSSVLRAASVSGNAWARLNLTEQLKIRRNIVSQGV